jgi:hypothetical protein
MFSKESLFAISLFPYLGFLWFLTRSGQTPRLALIGFYMTLVFVAVTIPAALYAQIVYGKSLADVDLLHGGAESFLTLANVLEYWVSGKPCNNASNYLSHSASLALALAIVVINGDAQFQQPRVFRCRSRAVRLSTA